MQNRLAKGLHANTCIRNYLSEKPERTLHCEYMCIYMYFYIYIYIYIHIYIHIYTYLSEEPERALHCILASCDDDNDVYLRLQHGKGFHNFVYVSYIKHINLASKT
jgi:hypothetical protein